jgi:hypothetical protein
MGLSNIFKLSKLRIEGFRDDKRSDRIGEIEVQYNPESLSLKHETAFQSKQGITTSSARARFSHSRSKLLNVSLVFDGTNVDLFGIQLLRAPKPVGKRVKEFLDVCYHVKSDTHEPAYLKLSWDQSVIGPGFDCRLQSVDINYTSFDRDGSPLHATLAAVFVEDVEANKRAAIDKLSSPDLTHRRVVKAGDTLPLLCREIYGTADHYLRVAAVNELDDVRVLEVGRELIFPPYDQGGR